MKFQCILASLGFAILLCVPVFGAGAATDVSQQSGIMSFSGKDWRIATDPQNEGREQKWYDAPRKDAKTTPVPWVIQNMYPGYHGVAWYWKTFKAPANPHKDGRYLLRFEAVDYLAEVWLNGKPVGTHEGGETPFTLDVTDTIRRDGDNVLAVRVLNPTYTRIDGIKLLETPHGCKADGIHGNTLFNSGGIVGDVELLAVAPLRITDIHLVPDWKTGEIRIRAALENTAAECAAVAKFFVASAGGGQSLAATDVPVIAKPGAGLVEAVVRVPNHRLWTIEDPALYRVTVRLLVTNTDSVHEQTVRCGFRDFRYENGYFRLNGKRVFLKGAFYHVHFPITYQMPHDQALIRTDATNMKKAGYNMVRIAFRSLPRMLEVCDEVGLLVYQEHYGSWQMQNSPYLKERWERTMREVVIRDRNHPSLIAWGMLNETGMGPVLMTAQAWLPVLRGLDTTRVAFLNSGRWDGQKATVGSLSNPDSLTWDATDLNDIHSYLFCPLSQADLDASRSFNGFLSEYGFGGPMDLPSELAQFRQLGQEQNDDAKYYQQVMDRFMDVWTRWRLNEIWQRPEDYFTDGHRTYARLKELPETAVRSGMRLKGYSTTHMTQDGTYSGCGLTTLFRQPKDPSLFEGARLANAPLRWCLFATPNNVYLGRKVRFEAVLANEDILAKGAYPTHMEITGPDHRPLTTREFQVRIEEFVPGNERPFAIPCFDETIPVDGPAGTYEFVVTMSDRKDIPGNRRTFYVDDPSTMAAWPQQVAVWGEDDTLKQWLTQQHVKVLPWDASSKEKRIIIAGIKPPAPGQAEEFGKLIETIRSGSVVVFLDWKVFADDKDPKKNPLQWLPVENKRLISPDWCGGFYRSERWIKRHSIFTDLPAGGMMDVQFYGDLVSNSVIDPDPTGDKSRPAAASGSNTSATGPASSSVLEGRLMDVVVGATRCNTMSSQNYGGFVHGMHIAVYDLGSGHFILNTLKIEPNLSKHPAAERLLRNMLRYAANARGRSPSGADTRENSR
jgi:hypothetical protein